MFYKCVDCNKLSINKFNIMTAKCSHCKGIAKPIYERDITIEDLYHLEKDTFSSYTGWSWVIMYHDKHHLKVCDVLTDKLVTKIDSGNKDSKCVFWRMLLEVARKHGVIK